MTIRKQAKSSARRGRPKGQGKSRRKPRGYGALPPKEPQRISLADAVELTQRYRKAAPASEHGGFFWSDGIQELLSQPGCVGLRYYHGLDADARYQIVFVGVDANGNDITKGAGTPGTKRGAKAAAVAAGAGEALLLDHHWPCPPYCDTGSPLF
jgi:hypothetical protein